MVSSVFCWFSGFLDRFSGFLERVEKVFSGLSVLSLPQETLREASVVFGPERADLPRPQTQSDRAAPRAAMRGASLKKKAFLCLGDPPFPGSAAAVFMLVSL